MKKMQNQKIIQSGTQTTGLDVIISRCSIDSQTWGPDEHPANVGCFFPVHKQLTKQLFKSEKNGLGKISLNFTVMLGATPIQRGYRKRMLEICIL